MNTNFSAIRVLFILSVLISSSIHTESFNDSLESSGFSATNANVFLWGSPNKPSMVPGKYLLLENFSIILNTYGEAI